MPKKRKALKKRKRPEIRKLFKKEFGFISKIKIFSKKLFEGKAGKTTFESDGEINDIEKQITEIGKSFQEGKLPKQKKKGVLRRLGFGKKENGEEKEEVREEEENVNESGLLIECRSLIKNSNKAYDGKNKKAAKKLYSKALTVFAHLNINEKKKLHYELTQLFKKIS